MKTNTGGSAFPYAAVHGCNGEYGMTLRDYFATHASEEDIKYWQPTGKLVERVAVTSSGKVVYQESGKYTREQARYLYADAMLKAKEDEFKRIEAKAKRLAEERYALRRAAQDDDDTQVYVKPWVGLTPKELNTIFDGFKTWSSFQITDVYFAIEAKLKEKNT